MSNAFSPIDSSQRVTSGTVTAKAGTTLKVRYGSSAFTVYLASSLNSADVRVGDTVLLYWKHETAYAFARIGTGSNVATATTTTTTTTSSSGTPDPGNYALADHSHPYVHSLETGDGLTQDLGQGDVTIQAGEGPGIDVTADAIGLGGDSILTLHADGSPASEQAFTGTGMAAAIAAASAGDVIHLPAGTITCDFAAPDDVLIVGHSTQSTIILGAVTLGPSSKLMHLRISLDADDATDIVALAGPDDGAAYVENCSVYAEQSGSGDAEAIKATGGLLYLRDCAVTASSVGGASYALSAADTGRIYAYGGHLVAGTMDVHVV